VRKSHLAQAIGQAAIQQGYRVLYRETHKLLDDLAEATLDGTRKEHMELLATIPLLIIDDLGMRKLPVTAAVETVHRNTTIDSTVRENVRAHLRVLVKRILRKYGYPPEKQEKATATVLEQAEVLSANWTPAYV
jgi:hypothetical protein